MFFNYIEKSLLLSICLLQVFSNQVGETSSSSATDKQILKSFEIHSFDAYKSFLQMLETHSIDKHFELKFFRFYGKNDYFQFLGIDPENVKAVMKNTGASSFSKQADLVNLTCSEIPPKHENPSNSDHPVEIFRNSFEHLESFDLEVDELRISLESFLTKQAPSEEFAQLARCFYSLSSDELKELYINDGLQAYPSEPYSKSTIISDEAFFKAYEKCKDKKSYLEEMATNLFIEKISQEFLMALPTTLKKIDLYYEMKSIIYLNMSSALKHLTQIESIDLWGEYFANPKLLILPQLKFFHNCQNLRISYNLYGIFVEYLKEASNGTASDLDLSKEKIQELSSKIGFKNLKKLKTYIPPGEFVNCDELIQLKLMPILEEVTFNGYVRLNCTRKLKEFIDDTSLESIIFDGFWDEEDLYVEIIRNPNTKKFDKDEFDEVYQLV